MLLKQLEKGCFLKVKEHNTFFLYIFIGYGIVTFSALAISGVWCTLQFISVLYLMISLVF
jgi:hypothetical protein